MYSLIKKILFKFDAEKTHHFTLKALHIAYRLGVTRLLFTSVLSQPKKVMNLLFPNPIGLSAGYDRNGEYIDALATLGFGFIEIGTITPRAQIGHDKPRIFRLVKEEAIINRLGFANKGLDYAVKQLEQTKYRGILGINIGKNSDTPNDRAVDDYVHCFKNLARYASYITINISSPNTQGLRDLQAQDALHILLKTLKHEQKKFADSKQKYVPLVVKISPDLTHDALKELAQVLIANEIDGVIATNTTIDRSAVNHAEFASLQGGLSGRPLHDKSTKVLHELRQILPKHIAIIASGGVMDAKSAQEKILNGADLIAVYTGLVYQGPKIINDIAKALT